MEHKEIKRLDFAAVYPVGQNIILELNAILNRHDLRYDAFNMEYLDGDNLKVAVIRSERSPYNGELIHKSSVIFYERPPVGLVGRFFRVV